MPEEKRRYFRITDVIDLSFRVLKPQVPDLKLSTAIMDDSEMLSMVDSELDTLLNALWNNEPQLARAMGLLNQKLNLLTAANQPSRQDIEEQFEHHYLAIEVSLSASGMAFESLVELNKQDRLEMYLLPESAVAGMSLRGHVVNVQKRRSDGDLIYYTCVEFDIEAQQREQLVQHVARRQVSAIRNREHVL